MCLGLTLGREEVSSHIQVVQLLQRVHEVLKGSDEAKKMLEEVTIATLYCFSHLIQDHETEAYGRFCDLINTLDKNGVVPSDTLRLGLDLKTLVDAGLIGDKEKRDEDLLRFKNRLTKINTNLVYRQQKYNLLREETEGYSKILVVLHTFPVSPLDASIEINQLRQVIGQFDLDPNRVLDLILDAFEKQAWNMNFVYALRDLKYKKEFITQILGFPISELPCT